MSGLAKAAARAAFITTMLGALAGCSAEPEAAILARLQVLEDREQIRELFNDYGRTLDQRDFAAFAQLFAADAEYVGGGGMGSLRGGEAISAALEDMMVRNPAGLGTPNFHLFFNENIDVDGDRAAALSKSAFVVRSAENRPDVVFLASYEDELVREHGRWKFRRRVVHSDIPAPPDRAQEAE